MNVRNVRCAFGPTLAITLTFLGCSSGSASVERDGTADTSGGVGDAGIVESGVDTADEAIPLGMRWLSVTALRAEPNAIAFKQGSECASWPISMVGYEVEGTIGLVQLFRCGSPDRGSIQEVLVDSG